MDRGKDVRTVVNKVAKAKAHIRCHEHVSATLTERVHGDRASSLSTREGARQQSGQRLHQEEVVIVT